MISCSKKGCCAWEFKQLSFLSRVRIATLGSQHRISNSSPCYYCSTSKRGRETDWTSTDRATSENNRKYLANDLHWSVLVKELVSFSGQIKSRVPFADARLLGRSTEYRKRERERGRCSIDLANLFLFSSYLSWKRKKEHAERERNKKKR